MRKARALTGVLVVGAVGIASLFAASPASAATLPAGQKITVIDQNSDRFYEASPADAALTPIGNPPGLIDECVTGVDVDDDGHGYAVASLFEHFCDGGEGFLAALYTADANTGLLSNQLQVTIDPAGEDPFPADSCDGIDYTGGVLWASCNTSPQGVQHAWFGPVDPTTGVLTPAIHLCAACGAGFEYNYFTAIARHPVTGVLWGFSWESGGEVGGEYDLWTLDPTTGITHEADLDLIGMGADFDRDGQLFITTATFIPGSDLIQMDLATVNTSDGTNPFVAPYTGTPLEFWSEALTVWGKEALPATGPALSAPLVVSAALLLLVGAILAVGATARRRSTSG